MKQKKYLLIILFALTVIATITTVVWFFGKPGYTPSTEKVIGLLDINTESLEVVTPWNINIDRTPPTTEPTIDELHQIYSGLMQSLTNRDEDNFTRYASAKLYWIMTQNAGTVAINKDFLPVSKPLGLVGTEYLKKYSLARFNYQIPWDTAYTKPVRLESLTIPADIDTIFKKKESDEYALLKDFDYKNSYRIYYNINDFPHLDHNYPKPPNSYAEDGYVDFVFEEGLWKVYNQNWQVYFSANSLLEPADILIEANAEIIPISPQTPLESIKNISIKRGNIIRWDGFKGMIMSTGSETGLKPWNSPYLLWNSYQMAFNEPGTYSYAIINQDNEIHGSITISD